MFKQLRLKYMSYMNRFQIEINRIMKIELESKSVLYLYFALDYFIICVNFYVLYINR